jgi:hypothetical protein
MAFKPSVQFVAQKNQASYIFAKLQPVHNLDPCIEASRFLPSQIHVPIFSDKKICYSLWMPSDLKVENSIISILPFDV